MVAIAKYLAVATILFIIPLSNLNESLLLLLLCCLILESFTANKINSL